MYLSYQISEFAVGTWIKANMFDPYSSGWYLAD